jgi:tripartite-type tricarboxylate transporter receptor subunit TctC
MALAAGFASQAYAQRSTTDYPTKPIKIIVPFPAGGGGDILARLTLSKLAQELGQSVVFENIGGAGGNVGVSNGSRAAAEVTPWCMAPMARMPSIKRFTRTRASIPSKILNPSRVFPELLPYWLFGLACK